MSHAHVQARFPSAPVMAVGYSLGALILTKYLSEVDSGVLGWHGGVGVVARASPGSAPHSSSGKLVAAAVVSSPVSLSKSSGRLAQPGVFSSMYNMAVALKMRECVVGEGV